MNHDCKELFEYKNALKSYDAYKDCVARKASILVDSAIGTGMTLEQFFHAMDELTVVVEKAKKLAANRIVM